MSSKPISPGSPKSERLRKCANPSWRPPHHFDNDRNVTTTRSTERNGGEIMSLTGKVAEIPGASKETGAAIAKKLASDGASVVVNYASSREGAENVVAEITRAGGKAVAIRANV